jgi:hypothetical protein
MARLNRLESPVDYFYQARPAMTHPASSRSLEPILLAFLACAAACLAISTQSLWVDEAQTALKAIQPTLPLWWNALWIEHNTNMQLPLYMLYAWGWVRIFGASELALRVANLPWFFVGAGAIAHFLRTRRALRNAAFLLYCLHPFVWFYVDQARPYLMQLSGAVLVAGALFEALDRPDLPLRETWWWLFGAGLVILCGAGILGVPWAIAITLLLFFRPGFFQSMVRHGGPALLVCGPLLTLIAAFFTWTIIKNIQANFLDPNSRTVLSVFYDQLGFGGLGPGRLAMRGGALSVLKAYLVPLALFAVSLGWGLILAAWHRFDLSPRRLFSVLAITVCPLAAILGLGYLRHTHVLSRHLTPLFPFLLMAEAVALAIMWRSGRLLNRAMAVLFVAMLACSSLEIRFASRHAWDDERSATSAAAQELAQHKTVWWVASNDGARYYHLPISDTETPGAVWHMVTVPAQYSNLPDEIFISRPDISDASGSIAAFIAAHHYHLAATWQAFAAWQK